MSKCHNACMHTRKLHTHAHTYSGPIHFTLSRGEVKLPSGCLTIGPSQCDMLGKLEGVGVQARCVWTETTDIGKDANTDNIMTCREGRGRARYCVNMYTFF